MYNTYIALTSIHVFIIGYLMHYLAVEILLACHENQDHTLLSVSAYVHIIHVPMYVKRRNLNYLSVVII